MTLQQAIADYNGGMQMKLVLSKYPDLKRNKIYYTLNKNKQKSEDKHDKNNVVVSETDTKTQDSHDGNEVITQNNEKQDTEAANDVVPGVEPIVFEPQLDITDNSFLNQHETQHKNDMMMADFGHLFKEAGDLYNINNIQQRKPINPEDNIKLPTMKQMETSFNKTVSDKKVQKTELTNKQKEVIRFRLIYQIRLFVYNYDHLTDELNIITNKQTFCKNLYNKNEAELLKLLDFIKFHVRFSNKIVGINMYEKILRMGGMFLEHSAKYVGVNLDNLADDLGSDDEIKALLKEICIEMEASKSYYGAKTDLALKILWKVSEKAGSGKVKQMVCKGEVKPRFKDVEVNPNIINKYSDL